MDLVFNINYWRNSCCVGDVKGMIHRHFASDIVAMLAIVAAILTNEALPGVVIVIMQTGGKALEDYAFRRASSSLDELMARSPRIAYRKMREVNNKIIIIIMVMMVFMIKA